jgi:hypothetical protein
MKKTLTMAALAVSVLVGGAAVADDTPASATVRFAHAWKCQVGAWKNLKTAGGGSFADQEACVAYTVRGGELFREVPSPAPRLAGNPRPASAPASTAVAMTRTGS